MLNEYNDLLTIEDLCTILNIGSHTAYELVRSRSVPAFKCGRSWIIPKVSLIDYIFQRSSRPKQT